MLTSFPVCLGFLFSVHTVFLKFQKVPEIPLNLIKILNIMINQITCIQLATSFNLDFARDRSKQVHPSLETKRIV